MSQALWTVFPVSHSLCGQDKRVPLQVPAHVVGLDLASFKQCFSNVDVQLLDFYYRYYRVSMHPGKPGVGPSSGFSSQILSLLQVNAELESHMHTT